MSGWQLYQNTYNVFFEGMIPFTTSWEGMKEEDTLTKLGRQRSNVINVAIQLRVHRYSLSIERVVSNCSQSLTSKQMHINSRTQDTYHVIIAGMVPFFIKWVAAEELDTMSKFRQKSPQPVYSSIACTIHHAAYSGNPNCRIVEC